MTPSPSTHPCPARSCGVPVTHDKLACRRHWYTVPKDLRDKLWAAYSDRAAHPMAHLQAVGAVSRWLRGERDA